MFQEKKKGEDYVKTHSVIFYVIDIYILLVKYTIIYSQILCKKMRVWSLKPHHVFMLVLSRVRLRKGLLVPRRVKGSSKSFIYTFSRLKTLGPLTKSHKVPEDTIQKN